MNLLNRLFPSKHGCTEPDYPDYGTGDEVAGLNPDYLPDDDFYDIPELDLDYPATEVSLGHAVEMLGNAEDHLLEALHEADQELLEINKAVGDHVRGLRDLGVRAAELNTLKANSNRRLYAVSELLGQPLPGQPGLFN